ncbi:general stress protein [Sinomonas atrocyanea]|uniref:general stress protein n=1 Tax=Sinomonas atrocyanea TaxID=37927 RepID=UPI003D99E67B
MSNMFGSAKPLDEARALPQGETVGSYVSYLDAQKAVDYLADQQFPVELVAIVGNDLKLVERVTGRLSYPRVALNGALSGMWFGLFVGVLLSFFTPNGSYFSIITSVLMGAAFFMLFGIVTYAMQRGKRDFTSTSQVVASNYDVVVGRDVAHDARRLLAQLPMGSGAVHQGWNQNWNQPGQDGWNQSGQQGWNQPGQTWQPPHEPEPKRPSGWTDPYGVNAGEERHPQGQPEHPQSAPQAPQEPQQSHSSRYPDLPDGRPQYGVRVEPEHAEHPTDERDHPAEDGPRRAEDSDTERPQEKPEGGSHQA